MSSQVESPATTSVAKVYLPNVNKAPGDIFHIDDESYIHVGFYDPPSLRRYAELLDQLEAITQTQGNRASVLELGSDCVVEYAGRRGGYYVRARIVDYLPYYDRFVCDLVDDFIRIDVHRSQIYPTNPSITAFPPITVKCKLGGMECFLGSPHLRTLYNQLQKDDWRPNVTKCIIEIIKRDDDEPTIRVITAQGIELSTGLQAFVPTCFRAEYPNFGRLSDIKVTNFTDAGIVWFQPEKNLMSVIKNRLFDINEADVPILPNEASFGEPWQSMFHTGSSEMFLYKRPDRMRIYRVRKLAEDKQGALIFYVDYGESEIISDSSLLFPARRLDINLCLIPPQCLPLRFTSAHCTNDGSPHVDKLKFWKYVVGQRVALALNNCSFSSERFGLIHSNKMIAAHLLDPVFNFFPPECGTRNETDRYNLHAFWFKERNRAVTDIIQDPECQKLKKYDGELLPPEGDLVVSRFNGPDFDGTMYSLCGIYHSIEHCHTHNGPMPTWTDLNQLSVAYEYEETTSLKNSISSDDGIEDLSISSENSSPPLLKAESGASNWVDYFDLAQELSTLKLLD